MRFVQNAERHEEQPALEVERVAHLIVQVGLLHLDFAPIAEALREMNYAGYASAEALPYPDPDTAAKQTINAFRQFFI